MPRIRQVDDISIVDWGPELSVIGEIRSLVEAGSTRRLLLNMLACDGLRADHLETLTEAFTVCEDRGCQLGMFGVSDSIQRLIEVMDLAADLPPIVGKAEPEALATLRGGARAAEARSDNGKQPAASHQPIIDFDLDAAHAPTARFDPSQVAASAASSPPPSPATPAAQRDDDLLGIDWTPLVAAGYEIGGHDPKRIVAMVGPLPLQPQAVAPPPVSTPSTARPTAASRRAVVIEDDVIDLGDLAPARVPVSDRRTFKTDVLPAFDLEGVERDLAERAPTRVLGGPPQVDGDDFSPLDTAQGPPAFLRNQAHPTPTTPPPVVHSHPTPTTPLPVPAQRPSADRKSERYGTPSRPAAAAQAPAPAPRPTPPAGDQVNPYYASGSLMESSDEQTVMIQPGMIDAAMLASVAMAENAAPAPVEAAAPPAGADAEFEEETVMFQPNALDAALLAEVAAVAGPETGVPAPRVEEPPAPTPPPGIPQAAMTAPPQDDSPDGREVEMRLFVHDHALNTPLHLQVLERLVKANETTFGKNDLHLATGGAVAAVSSVLEQLVQSRLVRRTRSPRVRGGTGFILSASPQARNTLVRLLKAWQSPTSRAKVATWLQTD